MVEIKIPRDNANDDYVLVSKVAVKNGDYVEKDDLILEFETSKATVEIVASESGFVSIISKLEGSVINVDEIIGHISEKTVESLKTETSEAQDRPSADLEGRKISKKAREVLAAGGEISDESYWITSKNFLKNATFVSTESEVKPLKSIKALPNTTYEVKQNSYRKQTEIQALRKSSDYLNSTLGVSIKTSKRRVKNIFFGEGILDLLIYEINNLLSSDYADLNCFYISDVEIGFYKDVRAGVALDTADNLSVICVSSFRTLTDLQEKLVAAIARFEEQKSSASEFMETTYTVSDLSSTSLDFMLPLINGQQTFIIGVTKSKDGFRLHGTFDHRITAGRRFGLFLEELKRRIELYFADEIRQRAQDKNCYFCDKSLHNEISLGNRGLIKLDDGTSERLICRACFDGW